MNATTLDAAIIKQIDKFIENNVSFSVHMITLELRTLCNLGKLHIPELESSDNNTYRYIILHDTIKKSFDEIWNISLYSKVLNKKFINNYFIYIPNNNKSKLSNTISMSDTLTNLEATRRIKVYLNNCKLKGIIPTPKQVQGAIKRNTSTGYSYNKIILIAKELGYILKNNI